MMSLLKALKGWREVIRLAVLRRGPRGHVSNPTVVPNEAAKYEGHLVSAPAVSPTFSSTFLKAVFYRASKLLTKTSLRSLHPRYAGVNRLRTVPFYSLVGLSLGLDMDSLADSYMDSTSTISAVRNIFDEFKWEPEHLDGTPRCLDDLNINKESVIGNGCEGAVFAAKLRTEASNQCEPECGNYCINDYDLAVKAVFNYGAESNASSILRDLKREVVPLQLQPCQSELDQMISTSVLRLPPHPNVVDMHSVFVDDMLVTEQGQREFPAAMPQRINPNRCFGRNKTLYLVMRKCSTKLPEFLSTDVSMTSRCLLLTQLLEAVRHMTSHGVAHRDLKADNILIDLPVSGGSPRLQVCDFGCCLAEESRSLEIPFVCNDINKGGNSWLMAPEISCAQPGEGSVLDFRRSDLWACGALAYQILGADNPFYPNPRKQLRSETYSEDELPPLPDGVPAPIQRLVKGLLARDPSKRPSPSVAVLVVQMVVWESTTKRRNPAARKRPSRGLVTKRNRTSRYVRYLNKERQKMGLVLAQTFDLIRKMVAGETLSSQDVMGISNFMCLSRFDTNDFISALKFFH